MDSFFKRVLAIQAELKAPKNQYNAFGRYNYRSCEDILEAAKPLCQKYSVVLNISDKIINLNERYYVEATVTLFDMESNAMLCSTASAREALTKKGMDDSQITGTASSYARKYALNGLFNIDDTKDADTNEYKEESAEKIICPKCGNEVKSQKSTDGTTVRTITPKEVYDGCGGMCYSCYKKAKENK